MPPGAENNSSQNLAQNTSGALFQMYSGIFGNVNFLITPSQTGSVNGSFGQIPYVSLEYIVYAQQIQAQTSPTNIVSGQNTGQQNIQGSYTIQDSNGLTRMVMGYQQNGF